MIHERRAQSRFFLHSQVEITGVDESGLQFAERARVEDVSDLGCRFSIRGAVHEGSILDGHFVYRCGVFISKSFFSTNS